MTRYQVPREETSIKLTLVNRFIAVSAVVEKHSVDKIGDKTAILRKYDMLTKILFCRHNNVLF